MCDRLRPDGPLLFEITDETLSQFGERLGDATYQRGRTGPKRSLSSSSINTILNELQIVLAAAGPRCGRQLRAAVLDDPPLIYHDPPDPIPKPCWTIDEARQIFASAGTDDAVLPGLSDDQYQRLARATIGIWYYTGYRSKIYQRLRWSDCEQRQPGVWFAKLREKKTGKARLVVIHPHLLDMLEACRGMDAHFCIPWNCSYETVSRRHQTWQRDIPADRRMSPQAWRRTHASMAGTLGLDAAIGTAQVALGHSSASITDAHYFSAHNSVILRFPQLET